jgi:hypothetical protein
MYTVVQPKYSIVVTAQNTTVYIRIAFKLKFCTTNLTKFIGRNSFRSRLFSEYLPMYQDGPWNVGF